MIYPMIVGGIPIMCHDQNMARIPILGDGHQSIMLGFPLMDYHKPLQNPNLTHSTP